jgi:hypothetical protein
VLVLEFDLLKFLFLAATVDNDDDDDDDDDNEDDDDDEPAMTDAGGGGSICDICDICDCDCEKHNAIGAIKAAFLHAFLLDVVFTFTLLFASLGIATVATFALSENDDKEDEFDNEDDDVDIEDNDELECTCTLD